MADPITRKRPRPPATLEKDDDGQSNHNRNNNNTTNNNSNNDDEADDQRSITTSSCSFSHTNFVESASRVDSNAEVPRAPLMDAPPPRRCMGKSPVKVDITDVDDGQSRNQQGGEDSPLRTSTNSAAAFSSSRGGYASAISDSRSVAATSGGGCVDTSRRMKQPTLAVYGMVSDTAVLKKELATRCEQVEELLAKGKAMDEELSRRDTHIHFVEEQVQFLTNKLSRFTDVMREEMLCAAQKSRVDARRVRCGNHFDLGQIVTWPTSRQEAWVEGNKKRELIEELAQVTRRRDEVEGLKKAAQNQLKQLSRQERDREDSAAGPDFAEALMDAQEELQLRSSEQAAHINRIAHIKIKLEKLEGDKKAFMKEIRRITDEDASDFVMVPTIGEHSRYVLIHLLGKGGFSEVWKAFDLVDGMYVACKIHRINREWPAQTKAHYLRHAERELHIMRSLNHSHLTKLYDVFQHNEGMSVSVMEYSKGMDLDTYLKSYRTLRESDARLILLQMASALRYLSTLDNPIIHYDLKPANILFHSDDPAVLEIKITDFGLSKIIGAAREGPSDNPSIELTSQGTGTYWYLPPECFETSTTPRVSNKVDIWSVGVIFYQMLFGVRPFAEGESQRKIWSEKLILSSARSINFPDAPKVSDEAKEVIRHCLAFNVSERYDILQLSNHPYLFRPTRRTRNAESERRMTGYPSSSPRPN